MYLEHLCWSDMIVSVQLKLHNRVVHMYHLFQIMSNVTQMKVTVRVLCCCQRYFDTLSNWPALEEHNFICRSAAVSWQLNSSSLQLLLCNPLMYVLCPPAMIWYMPCVQFTSHQYTAVHQPSVHCNYVKKVPIFPVLLSKKNCIKKIAQACNLTTTIFQSSGRGVHGGDHSPLCFFAMLQT